MEAATSTAPGRSLEGEKAQRIVAAMRSSVARRGVAGSTFDHVAREAGVSRGLLHYYFGTKEALLVEVVRQDCDLRMRLLDEQLSGARSADDVVALLRTALETYVRDEPDFVTVVFEIFTLSRRNGEVAAEFVSLLQRTREQVAAVLNAKAAEGVLHLRAPAEVLVDLLFSLADGLTMRMLAEDDRDWTATIDAAVAAVRGLLDDRA